MKWWDETYKKAGEGTDGNDEESTKVRIGDEGSEDRQHIGNGGPSVHHFCTVHNSHSVTIHQIQYHVGHDSVARHLLQTLVHWIHSTIKVTKTAPFINQTANSEQSEDRIVPMMKGMVRKPPFPFSDSEDEEVPFSKRLSFAAPEDSIFSVSFRALNLRGTDAKTW